MTQKENPILKALNDLYDKYPYKKAGDRESYSEYRQGMADAIDLCIQEVERVVNNTSAVNKNMSMKTKSAGVFMPSYPIELFEVAMEVIKLRENDKESGNLKKEAEYVEMYSDKVRGASKSGALITDATCLVFHEDMGVSEIMKRRDFIREHFPSLYKGLGNVICATPTFAHPYIGLLLLREIKP